VLASADDGSVTAVAADLGVSRDTVRKLRSRFLVSRLEGLGDEPRPGAQRTMTDEQVELVITKTLEERGPGEDTHWSTPPAGRWCYSVSAGVAGRGAAGESPVVSLMPYRR
jgi:hypothetical protein